MEESRIFQSALSNFATDVACGGAIRHLVNSGCTLEQIVTRLDYPVSREKAQRIMMEYLHQSRVLLREEPSDALWEKQTQFVQEQDAYGRRTLRKIEVDHNSQNKMTGSPDLTELSQREKAAQLKGLGWKELSYDLRRDGKLTGLLHRKCEENGEAYSYISCSFACLNDYQNGQNGQNSGNAGRTAAAEELLACLNGRQREYLLGIRWESPVLYHRLDQRMREIAGKLYEAGIYSGVCFFATGREKITIPARQQKA